MPYLSAVNVHGAYCGPACLISKPSNFGASGINRGKRVNSLHVISCVHSFGPLALGEVSGLHSQGERAGVVEALDILVAATERYKELCEGAFCGKHCSC